MTLDRDSFTVCNVCARLYGDCVDGTCRLCRGAGPDEDATPISNPTLTKAEANWVALSLGLGMDEGDDQ